MKIPGFQRGDGPMLGISVGHAMTHWYPGAFTVMLPLFADDLDLTLTQVGILIGLRSITSTIVNLPGGMIVDMVGRHKLVMAMAIAWAGVPYLFLGITQNFVVIAVLLSIVGIGNLLYHPAALSSLSDLYPTRRGFATAMHSVGQNFGDTVAPAVAGVMLQWLTWRELSVYNVIPGMIMGVIFWRMMRNVEVSNTVSSRRGPMSLAEYTSGVKALLRDGNMLKVAGIGGARATTQSALSTFLPIYLTANLGMSTVLVGTYLAVTQAAGLISVPISGALSDRIGRRPVIVAGMVSTSVMLVALMALQIEWLFIFVLALIGFFLYSMTPVLNAWALEVAPPELGGTSIGILFAAQSLLGSIAPIVGGLIADRWGIPAAFYFIAATVLATNLLVGTVKESRTEHQRVA
ncbi:MAG: MFS transporter [Chloroflexota bacterium]